MKGNRSVPAPAGHVKELKGGRAAPAAGPASASRPRPVEVAGAPRGFLAAWTRFWFAPVDPIGLHWLRFLSGLLFLCWLLPFAGQYEALFGLDGWFDREAFLEASRLPGGSPVPLGWSFLYLCGSDPTLLALAYWGSIAVLALFTLGIATRVTAVLTWVIVVSFLANPAIHFDADFLLGILAFYLMIGHVLLGQWGRPLSLLARVTGSADGGLLGLFRSREAAAPAVPSHAANLTLRLVQVHFALILVTSGLHKLQFGDWWSGVAYWYPLHRPFETTAKDIESLRPSATLYLFALSLVQYVALAWQLGFPLFAWRKSWWPVLLGGAALGWLGTALVYRQPLFGPVFFIACLSFLGPETWRRLTDRLGELVGRWTSRAGGAGERVQVEARA